MVKVHAPDASGTTRVGVSDDDTHDDGVSTTPVVSGTRGPFPDRFGNGGNWTASPQATGPTGVMMGARSTASASAWRSGVVVVTGTEMGSSLHAVTTAVVAAQPAMIHARERRRKRRVCEVVNTGDTIDGMVLRRREGRGKFPGVATVGVLWLVWLLMAASPVSARDTTSPEQELVVRHAPVLMLQQQVHDCGPGEPYDPVPVEVVLGNPEVALRQVGTGDPVVRWGITAEELADYGAGFYLDSPGSALTPGCLYETDGRRFAAAYPPTIYARVVPPTRPGVQPLVVQYWFYWYFNDWNDKHEGDWEGIQVLFPAASAAEALQVGPTEVGYAQHEGGESAGWSHTKLERRGDRPVVYSSVGSHASYFTSAVSLGRGASEGFGCDDTTGPSRMVDPQVVLLPTAAADASGDLAWLNFNGRWGERWSGPFNGPTGPSSKPRWHDPWAWQESLRDGSIAIPGGTGTTAQLVSSFCSLVGWGSNQVIALQLNPLRVLVPAAGAVVLLGWVLRRTGEPLRQATSVLRTRARTLAPLGLLGLPVSLAIGALVWLTRHVPVVDDLVDLIDPVRSDAPTRLFGSMLTGGVAIAAAFTVVTAAVAATMTDDSTHGGNGLRFDLVASAKPLAGVLVRTAIPITLLGLTTVGVPVALWLFARWYLASTVVVREGLGARQALRRSNQLVRGRTGITLATALVTQAVMVGAGLVVGLVVLATVTGLPLWALTMVVTAVTVVIMPWAAAVVVGLYDDARARSVAP